MILQKIIVCDRSSQLAILSLLLFRLSLHSFAQELVINEVMASNSMTISDEDGDTSDWIELFNTGNDPIDLAGFQLADSNAVDNPWIFPEMQINAGEYLLIYASDKDRREPPLYWETVIDWGDEWKYVVPNANIPQWNTQAFDDSAWLSGPSGFGYGDNDDNTIIQNNSLSVFIRKAFTVTSVADVQEILLHIDYDDAFVAYLNGNEIARGNITSAGAPDYDHPADNYDHEARMFQGGQPELFVVDDPAAVLQDGSNVLAIQIHNFNAESSDLTAIPFLSLGKTTPGGGQLSEHLGAGTKQLHTNFKITSDGEFLLLLDPSGDLVDSVFTRQLPADVSLGRKPDGAGSWQYFQQPTPGASNDTPGFETMAGEVSFSVEGGYHNDAFQLELTAANEQDKIYYTTDGSLPGISATLYNDPISVNQTMVVRARILNDNSLPGTTKTHTYLLQTSHQLPVISISTDPDHLWDYNEGLYVMGPNAESATPHYGANFWQDWERPIHIEMYEPDGDLAFAQDAGVRIFGGWSRANAQKSLAIFARKSYGEGTINYQIFPDMDMDEFSSLVLRNSGNDWNNTMFRDALLTSLFHEDVDKQSYRPAVIYLNGEYWGMQNIREKVNEDFLGSHHDLDPDDIIMVETNAVPVEGDEQEYKDLITFITNNNLSSEANYAYVAERMDVFNYIQYLIGNIYADNKDWPGNNIKYWKSNATGSKWRWITYDTDFGFDIYNEGNVNYNTLRYAKDPYGPDWPNPPWSTLLFRKLLENESFKNDFINAFADRLNTALLPELVQAKIEEMKSRIAPEIGDHLGRWGGNMGSWEWNVTRMHDFAADRPTAVRQHIRTEFNLSATRQLTLEVNDEAYGDIQINTLSLNDYPWKGIYFQGVPVQLRAVPQPGYAFVRWDGDFTGTSSTLSVNLVKNSTVMAIFEEGDSELNSIVINEINYNSSDDFDTDDWVELHNKGSEDINISGWILKDDDDTHEFIFPENTVLNSGEFLVVCRDMAAFSALVSGVDAIGDMDFGLSSAGDCVRLYTHEMVLTDEVCFLSQHPWPASPDGTGATLALKNPSLDNTKPANWYGLSGYGTPGAENLLALGALNDPETALQVYPNPVKPGLSSISYFMNEAGEVTLDVYNVEGRLVKKLYEGMSQQGQVIVSVDFTGDMHPGVYFLVLHHQGRRSGVRFILE